MKNKRDKTSRRGTPIDGSNFVSRLSITLMVASFVLRRFSVNGNVLRHILLCKNSTNLDNNKSSRTFSRPERQQYMGLLFYFPVSSRISVAIHSSSGATFFEAIFCFCYPICYPTFCLRAMLNFAEENELRWSVVFTTSA